MTWLVFGVSCLLVLAGAVSIISGAPIIQLERGWAEVISGTVALSSGGVVFALAGILMRLEAIRDTMAARSLPVEADRIATSGTDVPVRPEPETPMAATVATSAAPSSLTPKPETVEPTAPQHEGASQGLWKRVRRPASDTPEPDALRQQGFPDRVLPDEQTPTAESVPAVVVPAHVPAQRPAPQDVATAPGAPLPPITPPSRDPAPAPDEAGQIGWLERSLFKGRPPRTGEPTAPRREPTIAGEPETPIEAAPPRSVPALPEPAAAAEPEPTPDLAGEQHGGATVVGRYQAGSASYVMYSDGTIEVETEGGEMHRFGSMDELKAFIAQQDTPVA